MKTSEIVEMDKKYVMSTYTRTPVVLVKGKGCRVWDNDNREYLDLLAGIAVNALGHCHPKTVNAVKHQTGKLIHCSNFYHILPQVKLAKILVENSFAQKAFFCNSGAEANEGAFKLARKYSRDKFGQNRYEIIAMHGSFHGRTLATVAATGQEKVQKGFEPLPDGFKHVPFNNLEALESAVTEKTCAVVLEVIQGEGGVNVGDEKYIQGVRSLCSRKKLLMILDEVQTGMGRTGKLFAHEHYGIKPDLMSLAKALGGGLAIGALLATDDVASSFSPGNHASTFGGNPVACAAALATISVIIREKLPQKAEETGRYFSGQLLRLKKQYPFVRDVRGKGLMLGMELDFEGKKIVEKCREAGLLINCTADRVLRFVPPLIITKKEIDRAVGILENVFRTEQK